MGGLRGSVVAVDALTEAERARMATLFLQYYEGVDEQRFLADLDDKDHVIVLRDADGIQGFSTLASLSVRHQGRTHWAVFSGDTVVDRRHWGTRVLGRQFLAYLFWQRLRRPFAPLWWFLISKGYKTYRLMANNFPEHWPRHEAATPPHRQRLLDAFSAARFAEHYDAETGLITFPRDSGRLRNGVAAASRALALENPRIRYFVERNPAWADGVELACLAAMGWSMPLRYGAKTLRDRWVQWVRPRLRRV